jgi:hypothetical protein
MEFSSGEFTCRFASHMDGEGRRCGVKELFGMIVREDDPKIGLQCTQAPTDVSGYLAYVLDDRLVLGIRHGEELRRMRQHRAADYGRYHDRSPSPRQYRGGRNTTLPPKHRLRQSSPVSVGERARMTYWPGRHYRLRRLNGTLSADGPGGPRRAYLDLSEVFAETMQRFGDFVAK